MSGVGYPDYAGQELGGIRLPSTSISRGQQFTPDSGAGFGIKNTPVLFKLNNWPFSVKVPANGNCFAVTYSMYNMVGASLPFTGFPLSLRLKLDAKFNYLNWFPPANPSLPAFYDPDAIDATPSGWHRSNNPTRDQQGYSPDSLIRRIRGLTFRDIYLEVYGGLEAPANATYVEGNPANYTNFWVNVITWYDPRENKLVIE